MYRFVRRLAVKLLILAALVNGLAGPWAHAHAMPGLPGHGEPAAAQLAAGDPAEHMDCHGSECAPAPAHHPDDRSHGTAPDGIMCSGALSCCGAVVLYELQLVMPDRRVEASSSLPPSRHGLTPPVGERPPLQPHV